jgi:hypothetical protein
MHYSAAEYEPVRKVNCWGRRVHPGPVYECALGDLVTFIVGTVSYFVVFLISRALQTVFEFDALAPLGFGYQ